MSHVTSSCPLRLIGFLRGSRDKQIKIIQRRYTKRCCRLGERRSTAILKVPSVYSRVPGKVSRGSQSESRWFGQTSKTRSPAARSIAVCASEDCRIRSPWTTNTNNVMSTAANINFIFDYRSGRFQKRLRFVDIEESTNFVLTERWVSSESKM